ncbi:hypothetical protein ABWK31_03255, partial [Bacillus sp. JJ353]|uniref:hypothetical protein n=1 Tax=Bacillus sp. JJ353 TaxID=3122967 RepID=UPI003398C9CF
PKKFFSKNLRKKYTAFIRFLCWPDKGLYSFCHIYSFLLLPHQKISEIVHIFAVIAFTASSFPLF